MDRISDLPDGILCHALSFLSTKEAALSSLLSKRWRDLFACIPNLCFEDKDERFVFVAGLLDVSRSFTDFVDRVLTVSGDYPLKKFSLKCIYKVDSAHVNRWISNVMSRGGALDRLYLDVYVGGVTSLPLKVFTCETLVELKLGKGFVISTVPENASLPAVKTLFLDCISFSDHSGCEFEALLAACHVLEDLVIHGEGWEHWKWCRTVSCVTLQRLTMRCFDLGLSYVSDFKSFTLDTPRLTYLDLSVYVPDEYQIVNLDSLVEAKLNLTSRWMPGSNKGNPANLIKGLRNVETLRLSSAASSSFTSSAEAIPVFENLYRLSVSISDSGQGLPLLLKKTPNLETLIIEGFTHQNRAYNGLSHCLHEYSLVLACPVKVLKMTNFWGTSGDFELLKDLLEAFPCLEMLKIRARANDENAKFRLTGDLLSLHIACKVQLKVIPLETDKCRKYNFAPSICLSLF